MVVLEKGKKKEKEKKKKKRKKKTINFKMSFAAILNAALTFIIGGQISANGNSMTPFLFFQENMFWHFMWISGEQGRDRQ